jgi:sarcosine oxidase subunit gamma
MADADRTSPLARLGLAARIEPEADAAVRLGWAQPAAMAVVRGLPPDGLDLPQAPNTVAGGNPRAFWLGPDEWLLAGDVDIAALERRGALVVDVGHARAVLTLAGARAIDVLRQGCPLDFDARAFPVGGCAQSRLAPFSVLLHRCGDDRFDLYVGRSYAVACWQWLVAAAAEYGYAVVGLDQ